MTPERRETARRFAAASKWVWLPGMACYGRLHTSALKTTEVTAPVRIAQVTDSGVFVETSIFTRGGRVVRTLALFEPSVPDLDDDLTRLGVLAVVRRAWGDDEFCTACMPDGEWKADGQFVIFSGPTEESAMLAALEAAPQ